MWGISTAHPTKLVQWISNNQVSMFERDYYLHVIIDEKKHRSINFNYSIRTRRCGLRNAEWNELYSRWTRCGTSTRYTSRPSINIRWYEVFRSDRFFRTLDNDRKCRYIEVYPRANRIEKWVIRFKETGIVDDLRIRFVARIRAAIATYTRRYRYVYAQECSANTFQTCIYFYSLDRFSPRYTDAALLYGRPSVPLSISKRCLSKVRIRKHNIIFT